MINIQLNEKKLQINPQTALSLLLEEHGYVTSGFAVAINNNFVPKIEYSKIFLNDGDIVQIVAPMQGG